MKANNGTGNNAERDNWETPKWLFDKLDKQYCFTFDCCANYKNRKTLLYSSSFDKYGEVTEHPVWMNPPFSEAYKMFKIFFEQVKSGMAIYRCDNFETKIWQEVIFPKATWIFIPNKRIAYEGMEGSGSRFPSALIGFNVDVPKKIEGTVLYLGEGNKMRAGKCPNCRKELSFISEDEKYCLNCQFKSQQVILHLCPICLRTELDTSWRYCKPCGINNKGTIALLLQDYKDGIREKWERKSPPFKKWVIIFRGKD